MARGAACAEGSSSVAVLSRAGFHCEAALTRKSRTEVWLARFPDQQPCVVKCATAAAAADPGVARLIEREWQFLRAAASPGVVSTMALASSERGPVLVTEFLPNGDLVTLAGSHPRLWASALHALAGTLRTLHGLGIVHRDVKPRNVIFDDSERPTLIDFASASRCGVRPAGGGTTAAYRAPFVISNAEASPVEDEYAFAAVVYELLVGRPPYASALRGPGRGGLTPLAVEHLPDANEAPARALVAVVNAALAGGLEEPIALLEVFQSALGAIIATQ